MAVRSGVEAVLIRRVVDRSVLTADFDPGVGLMPCWFAWLPSAGVRLSVE